MFENKSITELNTPDPDFLSIQEIFLDDDVRKLHSSIESKSKISNIYLFFAASFLLLLIFLAIRAYGLQVVKGDYYRLAAEGNRIRNQTIYAPRGLITDRNGQILVRNLPSFELVAIPNDLPDDDSILRQALEDLAHYIEINPTDTYNLLITKPKNSIEPITIIESITQDQSLIIEPILNKNTGIKILNKPIRDYIDGEVFANVIGYVGKLNQTEWEKYKSEGYEYNDTIGKSAIEFTYEDILKGDNGRVEVEVDAKGNIQKELQRISPKSGHDLVLTIDADLQKTLYNSLQKMLEITPSATGAAAVAINPKTGELLSLVTLPSYDNNLFSKGIKQEEYSKLINDPQKPMFNRAISGLYPPGSTIKPVMAYAALEEDVITDKTIINDIGYIKYGSYTYHGWNRSGLGPLDVYKAIVKSSDPFFYVVGGGSEDYNIDGLGIQKIIKYFKNFGMGSKLGISLPNESSGFLPSPEWKAKNFAGTDESIWYIGNTYHISIGQGYLLTTPLQVAAYTSAFANNGTIMKPILTNYEDKEVISSNNSGQDSLDIVKEAMREVVLSGSAVSLKELSVTSAGKTGTSQFDAKNLARTHAWFTGFAPFEDPQIVITVLVESGGEGHQVAIPVFRDALRFWANNRYNQSK